MDDRHIVRLVAAARVAVGVATLVAPRLAGRALAGRGAWDPDVAVVIRAFGARDLALGWGALQALEREADPASWARLAAWCDAADAVAAVLATRHGTTPRRLGAATVAGITGFAGIRAASRLR